MLVVSYPDLTSWPLPLSHQVYTFPGWASPVLAVVQSPAVDVVGIGLESGGVVLHNLRYDETVMRFHQEWGPVTGLSFRTGRVASYPGFPRPDFISQLSRKLSKIM